jgi:pectate lyase
MASRSVSVGYEEGFVGSIFSDKFRYSKSKLVSEVGVKNTTLCVGLSLLAFFSLALPAGCSKMPTPDPLASTKRTIGLRSQTSQSIGSSDNASVSGGADVSFDAASASTISQNLIYLGADVAHGSVPDSKRTQILNSAPGWAKGIIGGKEGTIFEVDTLAFVGPRSLKTALESEEPLWIVFKKNLSGTIVLDHKINVKSFKTVDARGRDITLQADRTDLWDTGLELRSVENVVILNLKFDGTWQDDRKDSEALDGVHLRNGTKKVWIHKCHFTSWRDGAIDAKADKGFYSPSKIAITNTLFTDTYQPLALMADDLTFARNYCKRIGKRCVQANKGAKIHMANNVVADWLSGEVIASKDKSQLLVEDTIFIADEFTAAGAALKEESDAVGRWEANRLWSKGKKVNWRDTSDVSSEFKQKARSQFLSKRCQDDDCWNELLEVVTNGAGHMKFAAINNPTSAGNRFGWKEGDLGGIFARSSAPRFFVYSDWSRSLTRAEDFAFSGFVNIANMNFSGQFFIGYLNEKSGKKQFSLVGLEFSEPKTLTGPFLVRASVRSNSGMVSHSEPFAVEQNTNHLIVVSWKGHDDRSGTLSGRVGKHTFSLDVPATEVEEFRSFGIGVGLDDVDDSSRTTGTVRFSELKVTLPD